MKETEKVKIVFVSFRDENDRIVNGYFELVSESPRIKIKSGKNIITIPESKLLKMKEQNE